MSELQPHFVLGFSRGKRFMCRQQHARFYLLPDLALARVRQVMFLLAAMAVSIYLASVKRVRIFASQGVYDALPLIAARTMLRLAGIRACVVVQIHGDWETAAFLLGKIHDRCKPLVKQLSTWVLRNADIVRVISRFTLSKVEHLVSAHTPIVVFPGFTDIDMFLQEYDPPTQPRRPTFLYAGVLTHLKGIHILIEALRLLRARGIDAHLIIAGQGEEHAALQHQVRAASLNEHVTFAGFVDQIQLRDLIRRSYAFVLPTLSEGFGRVVIEAMACARPVVASRTGGIPELIQPGENGLLTEPGNARDLSAKLQYLMEHPEHAGEMGLNGRRFVRDHFSNAAYFSHYEHMLNIAEQTLRTSWRK